MFNGLFVCYISQHKTEDLALCVLGIFHAFVGVCLLFSKLTFSKKSFRISIRESNSLDQDQDQHFVGPDLGLICLHRLSADAKSCR